MNKNSHQELVNMYLEMIENDRKKEIDDTDWTPKVLAGYFLYNYNKRQSLLMFRNVKNDILIRKECWKILKKVFYPRTYVLKF